MKMNMQREFYESQVALVVRTLLFLTKEKTSPSKRADDQLVFRDLPCLSIDIDVAYLPIEDRNESLAEINGTLDHISSVVENGISDAKTLQIKSDNTTRLIT